MRSLKRCSLLRMLFVKRGYREMVNKRVIKQPANAAERMQE